MMPVYARQASNSPYPVLAQVLVSYDGRLGYGRTLHEAITRALASAPGSTSGEDDPADPPSGPTPSASPTTPTSTPTPTAPVPGATPGTPGAPGAGDPQALLNEATTLFEQAEAAGKAGDFVRREELLSQAEAKVQQALEELGQ
jgi:uncharacterized membrane protein (UPF0182 family)